jgi:AcrR family transcriptional regulator
MNFTYIVYVYYDAKVKSQALDRSPMENAGPFKTRREEYADATREALVVAAGELFTSEGYQQVGIEAIARKARVTRGAFYHHFSDKTELFDALVVSLQTAAAARVRAVAEAAPKSQRIRAGIREFLEVCSEPAYRHLVIEAAPAVLGAARCREIEEAHIYGLLIAALSGGAQQDEAAVGNPYLAARMIGRMVCEAALLLDDADDPKTLKAEALAIVEQTLATLTSGKRRPARAATGRTRAASR